MRVLYGIAFLIFLPLVSAFAQDICSDSRYQPGGFALGSTDICHNETVTITNTGGVENPKYYYNYRGESYEEVLALGGITLDFSTVTRPGLYQVIQVGKKEGKETVQCREIKVRNSTTPVFSYNFCTVSNNNPTRIEVIIPSHPLNDYDSYIIELNGNPHPVTGTNIPYSFPVQNIPNSLKVTGVGGPKTCSSVPQTTMVQPYNPNGRNYEYYPEIKELRVLDDKSIRIDFQGQYEESYNLFRYEAGQPNMGLSPVRTSLKPSVPVTDTPANPDQVYCYFIQPATATNCGLFPLRSADICSVPLTLPLQPTPIINYLRWGAYTESATSPPRFQQMEVMNLIEGESSVLASLNKEIRNYQHNHGDCSKKNCYRIRLNYAGVINGANYYGTSLSNQLCVDHRLELTGFPPNAFVSTENRQNLIRFDPDKNSPYTLDRWELYKFDGTVYNLLETLPAGASTPVITDPGPATQSEKYKVRYVDECKNVSAFSPEISSLALSEDNDNVLDWTNGNPFAEADIVHYEVLYYEGENQNNLLGTRRVNPSIFSHPVNSASFTNMGTFRLKAVSSDGRESFSNPVTFAVKGAIYLPSAFTPNGDQINDSFTIKGNLGGIKTFHMAIFSSSGQKIADVTDPSQGWDGKLPNGTPAIFGNYLYTLKAEMTNGHFIDKNGSFVLLY